MLLIIDTADREINEFLRFLFQSMVSTSNQAPNHFICQMPVETLKFYERIENDVAPVFESHSPAFYSFTIGFKEEKNRGFGFILNEGFRRNKYNDVDIDLYVLRHDKDFPNIPNTHQKTKEPLVPTFLLDLSAIGYTDDVLKDYDSKISNIYKNTIDYYLHKTRYKIKPIIFFLNIDRITDDVVKENPTLWSNAFTEIGLWNPNFLKLLDEDEAIPSIQYYLQKKKALAEIGDDILRTFFPKTNNMSLQKSNKRMVHNRYLYSWSGDFGGHRVLKYKNKNKDDIQKIRKDIGPVDIYSYHMYQAFLYTLWDLHRSKKSPLSY